MAPKLVLLAWLVVPLLLAPGCKHVDSSSAQPSVQAEAGHVVQRARIEPSVRVAAASVSAKPPERAYWAMTPREAQCRAADKSGTADMMEKEYQALDSQNCLNCLTRNSKSTATKKTMLRHASVEARNVAAGTALELYYRLAELEAKTDLLRDGLVIVADALAELEKLKEQGLKVPPELAQLQKQQLQLAGDLTRAQLGIQQINGELARLLNWHELGLTGYLWPVDSFKVAETHDDPEAAVAVGMARRAQLTLIRAVGADVNVKTLPAMMLLLRSYNGFLGMGRSESFVSFMGPGITSAKRDETDKRRQQMDDLLREQEFVVAQEIRQAIHTVGAKASLIALAQSKIKLDQDKLSDVANKKKRGLASVLDVSAQRWVLDQSKGELIQEVMAWHTAQAKLRQAQGLLAADCGYTPENPWSRREGTCSSANDTRLASPYFQPIPH
jgi:outer membrane protein TolC